MRVNVAAACVVVFPMLYAAATLPHALSLEVFAFGDRGWPITTDRLLDDGLTPTADFAYFYGLLPLTVNRAWFAAVGRTPQAEVGLLMLCHLATAVGIARWVAALDLRGLSGALVAIASPFVVVTALCPSPAHALEAALLANALAEHARGRPGSALALVTVAVFVKPSLGYFYGLILLVLIVGRWADSTAPRWRLLLPATVAGLLVGGLLVAQFGWQPVVRTQIPLDAAAAYKGENFGFFTGVGSQFWRPDRLTPVYYLFSLAGLWLAATAVLLAGAVALTRRAAESTVRVILTTAALHVVATSLFFGNQWAYIYYPFLPVVGAAAVVRHAGGAFRAAGVLLVVLAVTGQLVPVVADPVRLWGNAVRSPIAGGLYAPPADVADWAAARDVTGREKVFVLTRMGCGPAVAPEFAGPRSWCLVRAIATPAEWRAVRDGIRAADWLLVPNWHDNDLMTWPELADDLKPFREVTIDLRPGRPAKDVRLFKLYRRAAN